jgi:hypothetical protein
VAIDGGGDVTITQPSSDADGLIVFGPGAGGSSLSGLTLVGGSSTATSGVEITGGVSPIRVTHTPIYRFGKNAIENSGTQAPQSFRIGPRRADGSLPFTGTTGSGGTVEVYQGSPASSTAFFLEQAVNAGQFAFGGPTEPKPGEKYEAFVTDPATNTSDLSATATVPDDVVSPWLVGAVATSQNTVTVQPSEPVDPGSVQNGDFVLEMATKTRVIDGSSATPDGKILLYSHDGWQPGDAGYLSFSGPAAVTDLAGNESSTSTPQIHVGGAPGDFIAPVITSFKIKPNKKLCFLKGPKCKKPGTALVFNSSEDGDAWVRVYRGPRYIGTRRFSGQPGDNYIRWDGKIRGRRMQPGRYKMYVAMEDVVGNRTPEDQQPSYVFSVKKVPRTKAKSARHR